MSQVKNSIKKDKNVSRTIADELFGEEFKSSYEFRPAQAFQGYDFFFLKKPVTYKFTHPVLLAKTKFNYQAKKICKADIIALNDIFGKFVERMKIGECDQYINGQDVKFLDEKYPGEPRDFEEGFLWYISLTIQGYKMGNNKHTTPVWKINDAKLTFW